MNQASQVPFGVDASVVAGYAQRANERLGNVDFIFENTGLKDANIIVKEWDGTTSPSGYKAIGTWFTVDAKGTTTKSFSLVSKRVGFFGSGVGGSTAVNITAAIRNPADLRGAQIDIVAGGRRGWGYDDAFDRATLTKNWGPPPDRPSDPEV